MSLKHNGRWWRHQHLKPETPIQETPTPETVDTNTGNRRGWYPQQTLNLKTLVKDPLLLTA